MFSKKNYLRILFTAVLLISASLYAQDTWTDAWQLVWTYDPDTVTTYHIKYFDIYKGIVSTSVVKYSSVDSLQR